MFPIKQLDQYMLFNLKSFIVFSCLLDYEIRCIRILRQRCYGYDDTKRTETFYKGKNRLANGNEAATLNLLKGRRNLF